MYDGHFDWYWSGCCRRRRRCRRCVRSIVCGLCACASIYYADVYVLSYSPLCILHRRNVCEHDACKSPSPTPSRWSWVVWGEVGRPAGSPTHLMCFRLASSERDSMRLTQTYTYIKRTESTTTKSPARPLPLLLLPNAPMDTRKTLEFAEPEITFGVCVRSAPLVDGCAMLRDLCGWSSCMWSVCVE